MPRSPFLTGNEALALGEIKASLRRMAPGTNLRIFGSRARGDAEPESDLDVAVVVPGLTRTLKMEILQRIAEIELEHLAPLSALVISRAEFDRLKSRERRIALDIEREGVPV